MNQKAVCHRAKKTKYHYNFWRPLTANRAGDLDGNQWTDPDGGWSPLLPTPAFPSYSSAHATLSGAARTVLERALGNHGHTITLANPRLPAWSSIIPSGSRSAIEVGHYILDTYLSRAQDDE